MKYEEFVAAVCKDIRIFLPGYTKAIIQRQLLNLFM